MRGFARKIVLTLALFYGFVGAPADACAVYNPPELASAAGADLVFVGKFEAFEPFRWDRAFSEISLPYGLYTFSVTETLKGDPQPEWKIMWWVNPLASNTRMDPEKTVIVIASDGTARVQGLVDAGAFEHSLLNAVQYIVIEPNCSSAPIFENSPDNRAAIDAILMPVNEISQ